MTTQNDAAVAAPTSTGTRRYTEQIHALVVSQMKEYILGLAVLEAQLGGYERPKEGGAVRTLLDEAVAARYKKDRPAYEHAVRLGRREMADRLAEAGGASAA